MSADNLKRTSSLVDPDERVRAEAAKVADAYRQVGLADA